ncbi:MAG: hypothetical protein ACPF9F_04130 [Acholeplasmataceae bacterium]
MYEHEKALFEAAITKNKSHFFILQFILSILIIFSVWMSVQIVDIRLYLMILTIVLMTFLMVLSKRNANKKKILALESYGQFIELFYQAMVKNHNSYVQEPLQVIASNKLQVSPRVMSDMLDDSKTYRHVAKLVNPSLQIDLIDIKMPHQSVLRKIIVTMNHMDDTSFEMRTFKKPTKMYPFKSRIRGYDVFATSQKDVKPYLRMYDKMRVHPLIDQLDITLRDDIFVASFKIAKIAAPKQIHTNKKNLLKHEAYVNHMLDIVQHITKELKEMQQ